MRYYEIAEGVHDHLDWLAKSNEIQRAFVDFLQENNTDKVLGECGMHVGPIGNRRGNAQAAATISASRLGFPQYNDLSVGISWDIYASQRSEATGYHYTEASGDGQFHHTVTLHVAENPLMETDVSYKVKWLSFPHEMQHYFDHKRGFDAAIMKKYNAGKPTLKKLVGCDYYNDPLEYNAHFIQGLVEIFHAVVRAVRNGPEEIEAFHRDTLGSYANFKREFLMEMPKNFYRYLNPVMLNKFNKRMYQTYVYIRDGFPDVEFIKRELEHHARIEAKWALEDAA